jgi:hypothetical protein
MVSIGNRQPKLPTFNRLNASLTPPVQEGLRYLDREMVHLNAGSLARLLWATALRTALMANGAGIDPQTGFLSAEAVRQARELAAQATIQTALNHTGIDPLKRVLNVKG